MSTDSEFVLGEPIDRDAAICISYNPATAPIRSCHVRCSMSNGEMGEDLLRSRPLLIRVIFHKCYRPLAILGIWRLCYN
jgi:hypothetical protein